MIRGENGRDIITRFPIHVYVSESTLDQLKKAATTFLWWLRKSVIRSSPGAALDQ